ncbi:MAG: PUR family DNA/RNA-binding protein [Bacteroidetes bacterium]|nr:PUR family DNA/RNA-binding protein [Bacteroidota bacterium]
METLFSKTVKAGTLTYFLDVKEAKNNKKYVTVTASQRSKDDEKKFTKRSVTVFSDVASQLVSVLKEAQEKLNSESEFSKKVKIGKISYFIDVKSAKNNTRYLSLTTSQPSKEDPTKYTKRSIPIFNNTASDFIAALSEASEHLK